MHSDCSPFTQNSHVRSEIPGLMMTRSPRRIPRTLEPMSSTTPAPSPPMIHGGVITMPGSPSITKRSRWFRAAARMRMRTSSGARSSGSAMSVRYWSCSSPPWAEIVNARTRESRGYIFGRILCRHVTASNRKQRLGDHCIMTAIQVPALGESIVEGTIARWLKNEGDAVTKGDALGELETDEINGEEQAQGAGTPERQR